MQEPSHHAASALEAAQAAQASAEGVADALTVSELRYRRLFEAARDGILLLDSDRGRITDANPFMTELLGYSRAELLGKQLWEIGLLRDKEASQEAFRLLRQEDYVRYEDLPLRTRTGEAREVEFVSNLYRENGHTVIQCNIRDITERKRAEAELAAAVARHGRQAAALAVLEERTRLAREIHDTLAQGFAGIATQMEAAEAALANIPQADSLSLSQDQWEVQLEKVRIRIGKARDLARESLDEARRSVEVLRLSPPEAVSLSETLAQFVTKRVLGTAVKSRYALVGIPRTLSTSVAHCLLRVGQEAIANAVEHAQAREIAVELFFEMEQVRLRVRDDGRGFDAMLPETGRFGVVGMRERAKKVQGTLTIVSQPGEGTDVHLTVPDLQEPLLADS